MAVLNSFVSFDIRNLDLNWYSRNYYDSGFEDNVYAEFNGKTYQDVAWVQGAVNDVLELTLGGFGMTEDWDGNITGGTVQVVTETRADGSETFWGIEGLHMSAAALYDAAQTRASGDEYNLFKAAFANDDVMKLSDDCDYVRGFGGNDRIWGYGANDRLFGDAGGDFIYGGGGNDYLRGGAGNDSLRGGGGADTLVGDNGADDLWAGNDNAVDTFVYVTTASSTAAREDWLFQFDSGEDIIDLSGIDARKDVNGNQAFAGFTGTTATADSVWYVQADADDDGQVDDILLRADATGDAMADFQVAIINVSSIDAGDLIL